MKFTKMHGAGNDFVIINAFEESICIDNAPEMARALCDRRLGIGADGLMLALPAESGGDFRLLFFNSDGSLGEMCGNGARCIARFGYEHGLAGETQRIETTAGLVTGERISREMYRIRLNDPSVIDLHRQAEGFDCAYVELGDPGIPHGVVVLREEDSMAPEALRSVGKLLRYSPAFPKGANISFVKKCGCDILQAITYERGVEDFTLACGTGCGSIAASLTLMGIVSGRDVKIKMPGGELSVTLTCDGSTVHDIYLTGPTCIAFEGETKEI